jgi:hypothetical protein
MFDNSIIRVGLIPGSDSCSTNLQVTSLAEIGAGSPIPEDVLAKIFRDMKKGAVPVVSARGILAWRILARMKGQLPPDSEGRSFFGTFHGEEAVTLLLNWGPNDLLGEAGAPVSWGAKPAVKALSKAKANYPFNTGK